METLQRLQHHLLPFATDVLRLGIWLLLLMIVFVSLERLFAVHPQKVFRKSFPVDLGYYFLNGLVLAVILGPPVAVIAMAALVALAIAVAFRKDRSDRTAIAALGWLIATFLILASPHYPWYFLALVPFLALTPSATAWALTLACPLLYASVDGAGWPAYDTRIALFMVATVAALAHDAWRLRRKPRQPILGETP